MMQGAEEGIHVPGLSMREVGSLDDVSKVKEPRPLRPLSAPLT